MCLDTFRAKFLESPFSIHSHTMQKSLNYDQLLDCFLTVMNLRIIWLKLESQGIRPN